MARLASVACPLHVVVACCLFGGSVAWVQKDLRNHLDLESMTVWSDRLSLSVQQKKSEALPTLLQPLQHFAEDLKEMGSPVTSSTEKEKLSVTTFVRKEVDSASFLQGADKTKLMTKAKAGSSRSLTSTVLLFVILIMVVVALCVAAPAKKEDESTPTAWWMQHFRLPFYVCAWMVLSAGLTIFNKWMFVPSGGDFPYVATLTWCHMLSATLLTRLLQVLQPGLFPAVTKGELNRSQLLRFVLPVAFLQPLTFVLGNTAYLYLSVSYIQMIKAAMPGMVFIISAMVGMETFSLHETLLLALLALGVAGCSHGELDFSWIGFAYQLSSFVFEAFRIICLKLMVSQGQGSGSLDPLSALFYVAPFNMLALAGPMLHELQHIELSQIYELRFVLGANCLTAFGLNIAGVCLMSLATAVTFTVCGLLKDFGLILGSTIIFGNLLTREEIMGTFVVIGAAALFQRFQKQKNQGKK